MKEEKEIKTDLEIDRINWYFKSFHHRNRKINAQTI